MSDNSVVSMKNELLLFYFLFFEYSARVQCSVLNKLRRVDFSLMEHISWLSDSEELCHSWINAENFTAGNLMRCQPCCECVRFPLECTVPFTQVNQARLALNVLIHTSSRCTFLLCCTCLLYLFNRCKPTRERRFCFSCICCVLLSFALCFACSCCVFYMYLVCAWYVFTVGLACVRHVFAMHLPCIWRVFGMYLAWALMVPEWTVV